MQFIIVHVNTAFANISLDCRLLRQELPGMNSEPTWQMEEDQRN
jgi:hypothetical protein